MEAVAQFERIVNDSGFVSLKRLTEDEIIGTEDTLGLLDNTSHYRGEPNTNAGHRTRKRRGAHRQQKVKSAHLVRHRRFARNGIGRYPF